MDLGLCVTITHFIGSANAFCIFRNSIESMSPTQVFVPCFSVFFFLIIADLLNKLSNLTHLLSSHRDMGCRLPKLRKTEERHSPGNIYSTLRRPQVETKVGVAYTYHFLDFLLGKEGMKCSSTSCQSSLFNRQKHVPIYVYRCFLCSSWELELALRNLAETHTARSLFTSALWSFFISILQLIILVIRPMPLRFWCHPVFYGEKKKLWQPDCELLPSAKLTLKRASE